MTNARCLVVVLLLIGGAACSRPSERGQAVDRKPGPATLELERPPAPPVTGANTITVMLKAADGTPIGDAVVSGELFMPVMESMGKSVVVFRPEGSGRYVGAGTLSMAGSWQITVTAKRDGQTVATRTFNLTTKS